MTALPLLWFATAARMLPLSTLGFLQYLGPSIQLLLAVPVLGEPLRARELASFALIWVGLAVFTADAARHRVTPVESVELPE